MSSELHLKNIKKEKNRITYNFDYSENLQKYFNPTEEFFIEYDVDVTTVPDGILAIPFVCNVLPIIWLLDADLKISEIDKTFYESISEFKKGYMDMYPMLNFAGKIIPVTIIDNNKNSQEKGNPLAFFSGGVDAFNTLVNHYNEKPTLLTLWGSDVFFDDIDGWNNVKNHITKTAKMFDLEYMTIKTNFRKFLNDGTLTQLVIEKAKDGWWHGFQHGIGIIGHSAPIAYIYNSQIVYIASSLSVKDVIKDTCASYPTIDNNVKWANTNIIHDGYEFSRQDKIKNICEFADKNPNLKINLRVCWESSGGKNCNLCEKCSRTILGILAEKHNPGDYGLFYEKSMANQMKKSIIYLEPHVMKRRYYYIKNRFLENSDLLIKYPELKWIINLKNKTKKHAVFNIRALGIRTKIKRILKKIIK